ncbi:unnamed protein product [Ectocarpus sp. 12 AP-2014]
MNAFQTTYRCASIDIGVINLAFCVTEFTEKLDGTFAFSLVHVEHTRIGNTSETIHELAKKLLGVYSTSEALKYSTLDFVFIEQQLSRAVRNTALAYVSMAYFETLNAATTGPNGHTRVVFVPPKNKFRAVRYAFPDFVFHSINFERRGRELKKLSVEISRMLFDTFEVTVGLDAFTKFKTKLDDVSDVFLQSFAFFLTMFPSRSARGNGRSFIGVEQHRQSEDADEKAK